MLAMCAVSVDIQEQNEDQWCTRTLNCSLEIRPPTLMCHAVSYLQEKKVNEGIIKNGAWSRWIKIKRNSDAVQLDLWLHQHTVVSHTNAIQVQHTSNGKRISNRILHTNRLYLINAKTERKNIRYRRADSSKIMELNHCVRLVISPPALQYFPLTPLQPPAPAPASPTVFFSHTIPAPASSSILPNAVNTISMQIIVQNSHLELPYHHPILVSNGKLIMPT